MSSQLIELGHQALAPLIGSHPLWLWVVPPGMWLEFARRNLQRCEAIRQAVGSASLWMASFFSRQ